MKPQDHFIGKPCTVITKPINRDFKEEANVRYFFGTPISIDSQFLVVDNMISGTRTLFPMQNVIAISEETIVESEEDEPIRNEIDEPEICDEPVEGSPFIDVESLRRMADQVKKAWDS